MTSHLDYHPIGNDGNKICWTKYCKHGQLYEECNCDTEDKVRLTVDCRLINNHVVVKTIKADKRQEMSKIQLSYGSRRITPNSRRLHYVIPVEGEDNEFHSICGLNNMLPYKHFEGTIPLAPVCAICIKVRQVCTEMILPEIYKTNPDLEICAICETVRANHRKIFDEDFGESFSYYCCTKPKFKPSGKYLEE